MANPPVDTSSHNIESVNNEAKENGSNRKQDAGFPSMPPLPVVASSYVENHQNVSFFRNRETLNPTSYQSIVHQFDSSRPSIAEVLFSNSDISQVEHSIDDSVQQKQKQLEELEERKRKKLKELEDKKRKNNETPSATPKKADHVSAQNMQAVPASNNPYWQQHYYPSSRPTHPHNNYHGSYHDPYRSSSSYGYAPPTSSYPSSNAHHQYPPAYNQASHHDDYRYDYRQPYGYQQPPPPPAPTSTITEYMYTASAANYAGKPPPMPKYDAKYEEHLQKRMPITRGTPFVPIPLSSNNTFKYTKKEEEERAKIVEEIYGKRKRDEEHESLVEDVLASSYLSDDDDDDSSTSSVGYTWRKTRNKKSNDEKTTRKEGYLKKQDITLQELRKAKVIRRKKIIVMGAEKNDVVVSTGNKRYHAYNHSGNSQFNQLIQNNLMTWRASQQSEKYQLIEGIKAKIEELDPPGRFLKLVDEKTEEIGSDKFRVMNNTEVHQKIKAALVGKSRKLDLDELLDNAPFGIKEKDIAGPSLEDLQKKYKEKLITKPTKHDVLPVSSLRAGLKQDYNNANHEGNKYFMDLVNSKAEQYAKACSNATLDKDLKFQFIFDVMDQMKALDPPGRFLRDVGMNAYVPMISEKVYERIRKQFTSTMKERGLLKE
ncbi:predicted protein [Chaetoceros tenuissimus]|uniref:DUF6824 domain-containing protein n=1 Tax=Chaetoceros tenuissimus TaxID=426638 RepID=A0AAD3CDH4_9STRA|nr:predicted protein [Chaetoceros tenuissimus]